MRAIATQAAWSVCVFVGHNRETYKTAEPTEMPFGMGTRAMGAQETMRIQSTNPCAAAMWPFVKLRCLLVAVVAA